MYLAGVCGKREGRILFLERDGMGDEGWGMTVGDGCGMWDG